MTQLRSSCPELVCGGGGVDFLVVEIQINRRPDCGGRGDFQETADDPAPNTARCLRRCSARGWSPIFMRHLLGKPIAPPCWVSLRSLRSFAAMERPFQVRGVNASTKVASAQMHRLCERAVAG